MTTLEALRNARELFLAGKHRVAGMVMLPDLLEEAAGGDNALAADALEALDFCTPRPWTFSLYLDGGELLGDGESFGVTYRYNRKPEEVAAVFGKACALAARKERGE